LIAAQAELSGLEQIYTDNNVRVRSVQARVNELQKKLNEIGSAGTPGGSQGENSLYPSIRKLPLLGVTYADLFRQTKIQETVYELLTQQYELAKVQEAKEIPTVKVLDPAIVPTKKSFPPRGVIVLMGTILGVTLAMTWILGKTNGMPWMSPIHEEFLRPEVFTTVQARVPGFFAQRSECRIERPPYLELAQEVRRNERRAGQERGARRRIAANLAVSN